MHIHTQASTKVHTHTHTRARAHAHTHTHTHAYTQTNAHTHTCAHTHTQSDEHTHIHTHTHTHTHTMHQDINSNKLNRILCFNSIALLYLVIFRIQVPIMILINPMVTYHSILQQLRTERPPLQSESYCSENSLHTPERIYRKSCK